MSLRDSLMEGKKSGFIQFQTHKNSEWFIIDELIEEIDNLRVCQCPPKDDLSFTINIGL